MTMAIGILLDDWAEREISQLRQRLDDIGIASAAKPGLRPYVTLAAADSFPDEVLGDVVRDGPRLTWRDLHFATLGLFGNTDNVLFLGVVLDLGLLGLFQKFIRTVERGASLLPGYSPGAWVPHCTLALDVPAQRVGDAVGAVHPVPKIVARVAGLAATDWKAGEQRILWER